MSEHIKIRKAPGTWVIRAGGAVLGQTENALELSEGSYPPVIYFPRGDIAMALLEPSTTTSTCTNIGTANYYGIQTKSRLIADAAWSYETPKPEVEAIAGHLAFYPDKVTIEEI